jgi:hypothetical protein
VDVAYGSRLFFLADDSHAGRLQLVSQTGPLLDGHEDEQSTLKRTACMTYPSDWGPMLKTTAWIRRDSNGGKQGGSYGSRASISIKPTGVGAASEIEMLRVATTRAERILAIF